MVSLSKKTNDYGPWEFGNVTLKGRERTMTIIIRAREG